MYTPNHIPARIRLLNIILSLVLLIYGTIGIIIDNLCLPGRKGRIIIHFHGIPAWIIYAAMLCAIVNMISVIIDHYDKRNNEFNYKMIAKVTQISGWIFFVLAVVLDLLIFNKITYS